MNGRVLPLADAAAQEQPIVEHYTFGAEMPEDVRRLFADHAPAHVALQLEWFELLARHVPSLAAVARLLVLRRAGHCVAAWPVQLGPEAGALRNYFAALFAPVHGPDVSCAELEALVHALRSACRDTSTFRFDPMDPTAPSFAALEQALQRAGLETSRYFRFGNWHLPCAGLDWQRYFEGRPGELRSTVKRMRRRFDAGGGRIEILTGGPRLDEAIEAYERVYAASWKHREPLHGFVAALIRDSAVRGRLRFAIAWIGEIPIAAQVWFVAFSRAEIFKLAYDDAYKRFSPGTLLTAALLQRVIEDEGVREVDYLTGDDAYKATWMTARRERWGIVAFDTRKPSGFFGAIRQRLSGTLR